MLRKFTVSNFKNFETPLTLDLSAGRYDFNTEYIKNKVSNVSVIYGYNACGKSNLMLALFDIVATITDKNKDIDHYASYQNVNRLQSPVNFSYEFIFDKDIVEYSYSKSDYDTILNESLIINKKEVIKREYGKPQISLELEGTDSLDRNLTNNKISAIKYVNSNSNLPDSKECRIFKTFIDFVNRMLLFWCLQERRYIGYENGTAFILESLNDSKLLDEFNDFMREMGVERKIVAIDSPTGKPDFYYDFGNGKLLPYDKSTPSNGEKALLLFFYWYSKSKQDNSPSIIAVDEFDAFYHMNLSKLFIRTLGKTNCQVILTSHSPSLISNEILRPDCYYLLEKGEISNFTNRTDKDIRKAQNLERMFKAGEFSLKK